jgi:tetrahydromethanopterin S-methyltransferase subunit F
LNAESPNGTYDAAVDVVRDRNRLAARDQRLGVGGNEIRIDPWRRVGHVAIAGITVGTQALGPPML